MEFSPDGGVAILGRMPSKKPKKPAEKAEPASKSSGGSGKHKSKRIGVNFTPEWHAAMRALAAKRKMPVLWYLMDLVRADAEANQLSTPALPWEGERKIPS